MLGEIFSPARAIKSVEFLKGRENNLQEISRAFTSPGRHAFIYGDRGVGKTSLALTSAQLHQSSDAEPICVSCDTEADLFSVVRDIATQAISKLSFHSERVTKTIGFDFKFLSGKKQSEISNGVAPALDSLNECVDIIRMLPAFHSRSPVIVIDEFDRIAEPKKRRQFAEFLKKVSDTHCEARIIICGIATSLDQLIDEHLSVARNLASIQLSRLSHDGRWHIINDAAERLGVAFPKDMTIRIGQISDGFPHYVHLVGEKILWAVFDDPRAVTRIQKKHFEAGVNHAVKEAEALPRIAYEKATEKYKDDYKEVLWALADGPYLRRQTTEVFSKSYVPIMRKRTNRLTLDKGGFSNRLNRLKTPAHGQIITSSGAGWFEYSDNIVRGFVRLKAQQDGIEIGDGYFNADDGAE